jgi:ABC-type glycerol-3-phosphate transport system substrate-binding protein
MNKMFRFCRILISLILVFSLLAGCGADSGKPPNDTSKTDVKTDRDSLTFRITWKTYSGRGEAISRIVDAYNKENQTAYQVEYWRTG